MQLQPLTLSRLLTLLRKHAIKHINKIQKTLILFALCLHTSNKMRNFVHIKSKPHSLAALNLLTQIKFATKLHKLIQSPNYGKTRL